MNISQYISTGYNGIRENLWGDANAIQGMQNRQQTNVAQSLNEMNR